MTAGKDARGKSLLTTREREVFELLVQDKTTKEIADTLFISEKTVRNHISNLMYTLCKMTGMVRISSLSFVNPNDYHND